MNHDKLTNKAPLKSELGDSASLGRENITPPGCSSKLGDLGVPCVSLSTLHESSCWSESLYFDGLGRGMQIFHVRDVSFIRGDRTISDTDQEERCGLGFICSPVGIFCVTESSLISIPSWISHCALPPVVESTAFKHSTPDLLLDDPVLFLAGPGTTAPYHWLHDALPRLLAAQKIGFDGSIIIPDEAPPFVSESLDLLGIDASRIITIKHNSNVVAKEAVFIEDLSQRPDVIPLLLEELRGELLLAASPSAEMKLPQRVYISRQGCGEKRSIINHSDIEQLIVGGGYLEKRFEELSLKAQIQIASHMEHVIAPHGAGMFHTLFMKKGTVIELFPVDPVDGKDTNDCRCWDHIFTAHANNGREIRTMGVETAIVRPNRSSVAINTKREVFRLHGDASALQKAMQDVFYIEPNSWHRMTRK